MTKAEQAVLAALRSTPVASIDALVAAIRPLARTNEGLYEVPTVRVLVCRLRKQGYNIRNVRGTGYALMEVQNGTQS